MTDLKQLQGAYGVIPEIEAALQAVPSGNKVALSNIMMQIEHQGTLYPLTVPVVRELIRILGEDNQADKEAILDGFYTIVDAMDESIGTYVHNFRGNYANDLMKLQTVFVEGGEVFIQLLNHADPKVRTLVTTLIAWFCPLERFYPVFEQRYSLEENLLVKTCLLYHLSAIPAWYGQEDPKMKQKQAIQQKQERLADIVRSSPFEQLRYVAAYWWVRQQPAQFMGYMLKTLPPEIEDTLFKAIWDWYTPNANPLVDTSELPYQFDQLFDVRAILHQILLFDLAISKILLASPRTTPLLAHCICRELIDQNFERGKDKIQGRIHDFDAYQSTLWGKYGGNIDNNPKRPSPTEVIYKRSPFSENKSKQYEVLQIVLENDAFWELPTNLFSFFYGLPDDREALRKVHLQMKP